MGTCIIQRLRGERGVPVLTACLCLAVAAACGGGGGGAAGPAGAEAGPAPSQAILFDVAAGPALGIPLPYTLAGIRRESGLGGHHCPPNKHVAPGGVLPFDPDAAGAAMFSVEVGAAFGKAASTLPRADPDVLDDLENDCDLLEAFSTVARWLDAALVEATAGVADLERCLTAAEVLYCELVRKVEAAETVERRTQSEDNQWVFGPGQQGRVLPDVPSRGCASHLFALLLIPSDLGQLDLARARCDDALAALEQVIDHTYSSHTRRGKTNRLHAADVHLSDAQAHLKRGREVLARVEAARASFVREDLEASCQDCDEIGEYRRPSAVGGVIRLTSEEPLGPLVTALEDAAAGSGVALEEDRYRQLAERLRALPAERVFAVAYPGRGGVGTDHVVLADGPSNEDGVAPLAVVLRELPRDADLPDPNGVDLALLHEAYRLFAEALLRAP